MSAAHEVWPLDDYALLDTSGIITPALLIYPNKVRHNIQVTLAMMNGDANRWRPHIKTAKLSAVISEYIQLGIQVFKCATTLELKTACECGAQDVLVAFAMVGANAVRVQEIASLFPATRVSVLIEAVEQVPIWEHTNIGVYLDLNSGMNRTGINPAAIDEMITVARTLGERFKGLHWYDGHVSMANQEERRATAFDGYNHLLQIIDQFLDAKIPIHEVITSGTPSAPSGIQYPGFNHKSFVHRISPGTVVYNDLSSLRQLSQFNYIPAALVLTTVISRPTSNVITCDAGHKSVSVDSGVPNCSILGYPDMTPLKPSEEHLPIETNGTVPAIGEKLYLLAKHICPTVNNFDHALMVKDGLVNRVEKVSARGHERPLSPAGHT